MAAVAVDSVVRLYRDLGEAYRDGMDGVQKAAEEAVASVTFPIFNFPEGPLAPAQLWKIMYLLKPASPSSSRPVRKKNLRRRRCKKCKGCLKEDCGSCYECRRKRNFAGLKMTRTGICKKKKCLNPLLSPSARCLICTQTGSESALTECSRCGEILHPRCVAVLGEKVSQDAGAPQTWECPKCCQCKTVHVKGRTYSGPLPTLLENSVLLAGFTDYLARSCFALGLCDADSLGWGSDPREILRRLAGIWVEHLPIAKKGLSWEDFEGLVVSLEDSVAVLEWYGLNQGMHDGLVALARRMVGDKVESGYWKEEDPYITQKTDLPKRKRNNRKSSSTANKSPRSGSTDSSPLENSSLFQLLTSPCSSPDSSPVVLASYDSPLEYSAGFTTDDTPPAHSQPVDKTSSVPMSQSENRQANRAGDGTNCNLGESGTPEDQSTSPDSEPILQISRKSDSAFPSTWYISDSSDSEDYLPTPPRVHSPQPANQLHKDFSESGKPTVKTKEGTADYIDDALDVMFQHAHPNHSSTSGSTKVSASSSTTDVNDATSSTVGMESCHRVLFEGIKHLQGHLSAATSKEARVNSTRSPKHHAFPRMAVGNGSPNTQFGIKSTATCPSPASTSGATVTSKPVPTRYPALPHQKQPNRLVPPVNNPYPTATSQPLITKFLASPQHTQPSHRHPPLNNTPPLRSQCDTRYGSTCSCSECFRPKAPAFQGQHPCDLDRAYNKTRCTASDMSRMAAERSRHMTVANIPPRRSSTPYYHPNNVWEASKHQLQPATNRNGVSSHRQGSGGKKSSFDPDLTMTQLTPTAYRATVHVSLADPSTANSPAELGWKVQSHPAQPLVDRNRYFPTAPQRGKGKKRKDVQSYGYL